VTVNPVWPAAASEIVLWAQLVCAWVIATYAVVGDWTKQPMSTRPTRSDGALPLLLATGLAGLAAFLLPPLGTSTCARLGLAAVLAGLIVGTFAIRRTLIHSDSNARRWLAEIEIAANVVAVLAIGGLIGLAQVGAAPANPILRGGKATAILCAIAAAIFVFRGGTSIVRAVLDKTQAEPRVKGENSSPGTMETAIDVDEFNRGRSIGNLERILMVMVIVLGSYEALGFLVAAKGLIRAREFENRHFAEYFILGSLTSAAIAMSIGMALRVAVPVLWTLQ
jgi:hypothetical protein